MEMGAESRAGACPRLSRKSLTRIEFLNEGDKTMPVVKGGSHLLHNHHLIAILTGEGSRTEVKGVGEILEKCSFPGKWFQAGHEPLERLNVQSGTFIFSTCKSPFGN